VWLTACGTETTVPANGATTVVSGDTERSVWPYLRW
jgi:hypothetical protein